MNPSHLAKKNLKIRSFLGFLLMIFSFWWVFQQATSNGINWSQLQPDQPWLLFASTIAGTLSVSLNGLLFWLFIRPWDNTSAGPWLIFRWHVIGQIARHLPGRLWGVIYQTIIARGRFPVAAILRANIDLMVFTLFGSVIVSIAIISYEHQLLISLFALLGGPFIVVMILRHGLRIGLVGMRVFTFGRWHDFFANFSSASISWQTAWLGILILAMQWIIYLAAWQLLGASFSVLDGQQMAILCAYYTLAWLVGYAAVVVPAGLGVREAAFIMFTTGGIDPSLAALLAVLARVWLMVIDGLLGLIVAMKSDDAPRQGSL